MGDIIDIVIQNKTSFLLDYFLKCCLYTVFMNSVDVILTVAKMYMVLNYVLRLCHQTYVLLSFFFFVSYQVQEENLHYAPLRNQKPNKSRRKRETNEKESVYSSVVHYYFR